MMAAIKEDLDCREWADAHAYDQKFISNFVEKRSGKLSALSFHAHLCGASTARQMSDSEILLAAQHVEFITNPKAYCIAIGVALPAGDRFFCYKDLTKYGWKRVDKILAQEDAALQASLQNA